MTETYSKAADFGGQLAEGQLHSEIEADVGITTTLIGVTVNVDVVDIIFVSAISGPEKTALDAVVAAHVPAETNEIFDAEGYIEMNSSLADSAAVRIVASNPAGGIDIDAGSGGITVDTTNAISLNAGAQSDFTTTIGNLNFTSAGVVNIEAAGGMNIGSNNDAQAINIGASASARPITLGNTNTTTSVSVHSGTGGILLDSTGTVSIDANGAASNLTLATTGDAQDLTIALTGSTDSSIVLTSAGTGADAIRVFTTGGVDVDATGTINFATADNTGSAIVLDAAFGGGGISISSGAQGIAINSNGGLIGIGHWSGGNMSIGTAAVARNITMGNITGTTGVAINSGTGGINIGGNSSTGEIHIGNTGVAKSIFIGNTTSGSRTFSRFGSGGIFKSQPAHTILSDADANLTVANLLTGILTGTPTSDRTLTLPTAATVVSSISGIAVDDSFDFHLINEAGIGDDEWIIAMGTGGTMIGNPNVAPRVNTLSTYKNGGTGGFRLRMTNVTVSSEAYTLYRLG